MGNKNRNNIQSFKSTETTKETPVENQDQKETPVQDAVKETTATDTATDTTKSEAPEAKPESKPEPEPVPAPAPVVQAPSEPVVMQRFTETVPSVTEFSLPSSVSVSATVIMQSLQTYVTEMNKKIIMDYDQGAGYQNNLLRTLLGIIRSGDQDFIPLMDMTCKVFLEHKNDCFSAKSVFRFMHHMRPSSADLKSFKLLVNMFMLMANPNPKNREVTKKHLNIEEALTHPMINEQQRQRVMAYFNI